MPILSQARNQYGHKSSYIKIPAYLHLTYWIFLKKKRFQCKQCNKTYFSATTSVNRNCFISNPLKHRKLCFLIKHFGHYSEHVRQNVKYVCTNMYEPFLSQSFKQFPLAKICINRISGNQRWVPEIFY